MMTLNLNIVNIQNKTNNLHKKNSNIQNKKKIMNPHSNKMNSLIHNRNRKKKVIVKVIARSDLRVL